MKRLLYALLVAVLVLVVHGPAASQSITDYTAYPPFLNQTVPPLVMLVMSRDHKLFIRGYNDISDLDGDGTIDTTYKDSIIYYGYFDSGKCYNYVSANNRFEPQTAATGTNSHYCSGMWSGNFLNWATMSRLDIIRKVLYGGHRTTDSTTTVLSMAPRTWDGHSWAKAYTGIDIALLAPVSWSAITFCVTTPASGQTASTIYVANGNYPYAASTEAKQCLWQYNASSSKPYGPVFTPTYTYNGSVLVCVSGMLETNCQTYTDTSNVSHYKPTGLMQQMGVDRQGTATTADDIIYMKFALISGSYGAHVGGGVLRSNVVDVNSEIDPSTGVISSSSQIISNIEQFALVQYNWSTGWYDGSGSSDNCHQSEIYTLVNNTICQSWGNPIGEMLYETIRYFQGKGMPTSEFQPSTVDPDVPGMTVSSWSDPYVNNPYCAKCFALLFTDPDPSWDSDHLPGSYWPATISTSDTPSVQTLIQSSNINTLEGIGSVFIGQSGTITDRICSPKTGDFSLIRGLCAEAPTRQGSFYIAGLAWYGQTTDLRSDQQGTQNLATYSVLTNAPWPRLQWTVGSQVVQIMPAFHDGCPSANWGSPGYTGCTSQGTNGDDSGGEIVDFKLCPNDTDWTTEQANGFTSCYDIMWDDADQGWDYELDVRYRIYVQTNSSTMQVTVKTKGLYGAAGHTDYAGYFIQGVGSSSGMYLDITCGGQAGFNDCDVYTDVTGNSGLSASMANAVNTRTFSVTGSTVQILNSPLWYAAKYGGFTDMDGSNTPNLQQEWDANSDGNPDTYFFAQNPLQLQTQLALAFYSILNKVSSGTSVSVLATSSTGDGSLYQSYFFPDQFQAVNGVFSEVKWTGYTQALFVDGLGNIREDTNQDGRLVYQQDNILKMRYDSASGSVKVDEYYDTNGDGRADSTTPFQTVGLSNIKAIWEAGRRLALTSPSSRTILTWVDTNNNGLVDTGEQMSFSTANDTTLAPYLRAGSAPYTADNIINFILGNQIMGMRNRQLMVADNSGNVAPQVWKYGDPINSTPTVVGAPKERFDVIYGDASYAKFFQRYANRRQVAYIGANDGMLHAFNTGFYHKGDDSSTTTVTEHGWFTRTATDNSSGPLLGQELWGFIPYNLLPHLQWLTMPNYTHVYYVDLKPKITDVRIFCDSGGGSPSGCINGQATSHPNGWGTILIGGFRMGGSCGACTTGNAPPMTVTANFGSAVQTRTFYSSYFVLDITDPETPPVLLWSYSDSGLGLTTTYPAVIRMSPSTNSNGTDPSGANWFVVIGSGPTGYGANSSQTGKVVAINLMTGPGTGNANVFTFPTSDGNAYMGDLISLDANLDFRVDAVYLGNMICNASGSPCNGSGTPAWTGKLYRLATGGGNPNPTSWGVVSGANRAPSVLLATFPSSGSTPVGPVAAAPTVTFDDVHHIWVFFGTGRYYNSNDKINTDTQYFFGVKDPVPQGGCTESTVTSCQKNNLLNVSNVTICIVCTGGVNQVSGISGVTTLTGTATTTLEGLVESMDGWYTILPNSGERSLAAPTIIGGTVFFTTLDPVSDVCVAAGNGYVYALYYKTGSAYKSPIIGTYASGGSTYTSRSMTLGVGLPSQMAVQIGGQGSGAAGASSGSGCSGRVTGFIQTSTGALSQFCGNPALSSWSRYVSWINQRD